MSDPTDMIPTVNVESKSQPVTTQPSATDATTAGAAASANAPAEYTGGTSFKSINDLKTKSPKLYNAMMQGIAMNLINQMRRAQERLKKAWREMRGD